MKINLEKTFMAAKALSLLAMSIASFHASAEDPIGPVTGKDVIYQIMTDRFFDGDPTNNQPAGFDDSLFDGSGNDVNKFQGGDFDGVVAKIPYLKNLGITTVWISAPYANRRTASTFDGITYTPYHGYHARNYFQSNPYYGDMSDFTNMVSALHAEGIKVVIDFVSNHTSNGDEDGRLFEPDRDASGNFVFDANGNPVDFNLDGSVENLVADPKGVNANWFHNLGNRENENTSRFDFRYKDLANLADFTHELPEVNKYLEEAAIFWKSKGVDGYRHDATLHMNGAFSKSFRDAIDSAEGGAVTHFGEFFIGRPDPKFAEYSSFPTRTGINNLDFEFFRVMTSVYGDQSQGMGEISNFYNYTADAYEIENQTVMFVDNHDVSRFLRVNGDRRALDLAITTMMVSRGIPNIYYGTEQYANGKDGSQDGGRIFMQTDTDFGEDERIFKVIKELSDLRQSNDALAYGLTSTLYSTDDVLVMSRKFFDKEVVIAINRNKFNAMTVPNLGTSLPVGSYGDELNGLLSGASNTVFNGAGGREIASFELGPQEVSVWSSNADLGADPKIGDMQSFTGRPGNQVSISGTGLDGAISVAFGDTPATVVSSTYERAIVVVPTMPAGEALVTVTKGAAVSNTFAFDVLSGDQTQAIFHVEAFTDPGENVFVVGNIPELGSWDPSKALDGFHNPDPNQWWKWFLPVSVPQGTTVEYKYIYKLDDGSVIWESGANRSFTSSSSATGVVDLPEDTFNEPSF